MAIRWSPSESTVTGRSRPPSVPCDEHPVGERFAFHAERAKHVHHRSDAVALFHAELGCVANRRRAARACCDRAERGDLVDCAWDELGGDGGLRELARARNDMEVRERLAVLVSERLHRQRRTHVAQHVERARSCRIRSYVAHRDPRAWNEQRGAEEKRGGGDVAWQRRLERRHRSVPSGRIELDHRRERLQRHAERREHALGVIARERRLAQRGRAMRVEAGEKKRALHSARSRREARTRSRTSIRRRGDPRCGAER